ncbi:MAG: ATP-binding protein [Planctomycetota bacterium]
MDAPEPTPGADAPDETRTQRLHRRQRRSILRQTFGTKLLTTFAAIMTAVTIVVFTVAGLVIHDTANRVLEQQLTRQLESVAALAAVQLNRPFTLAQASHPDPVVRTQAVERLEKIAREVRERAGVREVVLFGGRDPDYVVLASSGGKGGYEGALSRLLADALYIERARREGTPTASSLYPLQVPDQGWQIFKSGYAPLVDERGEVSAMVAVEVPADFTRAVEEVNNSFRFLGACAGLAVLAAAVFLVRQRVHLPIYRLVKAMQGEDGAPQTARIRHRDEIGIMTEHYNDMVDRLLEKDQELRELYARAQETATYLKGYSNHLVAGVPSGVVAVDPGGRLTVYNESASRILRQTPRLGAPVGETLGAEHPVARALTQALVGSVTDQALMVLGEHGAEEEEQRLVELTCAPFRDDDGDLLGAVALVTDRTELERFRQVAARNERLAAIGNLGAGLAHEIKNPLGAISGFAELIERKADEGTARLAARLRGEVHELNDFLNQFLTFTREDAIRREPTDLNAVVERSVELAVKALPGLDPEALVGWRERGKVVLPAGQELHLRLELAEQLPPLALDERLIRSACTNLAKNALEAMRERGGELRVRTHRIGEQAFVRFSDTGPGVPLELREKIFNPLFTTRAEGTGLGLAIANKTITAHRGKLSLREAPGGGAEFVIRLPVVAAAGVRE